MSVYSANWSRSSISSARSRRSGKSLADKMRDLGFKLSNDRGPKTWNTLQHIDIKIEDNRPSKIYIMTPKLNLEPIIYYQPETVVDKAFPEKNVYKIDKFETRSVGPKEIKKISDIEVKSFRPSKQVKFRKKKRRSTIITKVEEILNKGKEPIPSRDPSEESILLEYEWQMQPPKEIRDLPESVLQKIFLSFSMKERGLILSRVCKSWYYILKDPVFWNELEFKGNNVPTDKIVQLVKTHTKLKKLVLNSVPDVVKILKELARCNHTITSLGVKHCDVGNQDFARIILHVVSCCTNLEVLDVKGMRFQSKRFYLELGRLKNFRSLNLSGNKLLTNHDLITLSINCRNLQDLRILDTSSDDYSRNPLKDDDLIFMISHLEKNLSTLKADMQQLGNVSYQAILKCSQLKCLALKNCLLLTSDVFRQFPVLKNLKKLKITRAINIKPEDFQFVFQDENMKNIRDLDINGCWGVGEIGLQAIADRLPFLKSLSLKNCKSIKGNHLECLSKCPELENLNIAHTNTDQQHLETLHYHIKNLRDLVIDSNVYTKRILGNLQKVYPLVVVRVSFSEFQKDERLLP